MNGIHLNREDPKFEFQTNLIKCLFQVTLIRIEDDGLFRIIFSHHFKRDTRNGRLEVCLLGINHYANVQIFSSLEIEKKDTHTD